MTSKREIRFVADLHEIRLLYSVFAAISTAAKTKSIKRNIENKPLANSVSIEIYSGIARFLCDSTAFLYM